MRYLITGGAGFIGSHLADHLLRKRGISVTLLDNLSTGSYENIAHLDGHPSVRLLVGSVTDDALVEEAVRDCDAIFHLASAVGVKLVLQKPVHSIETIVKGTNAVLNLASRYRKPFLVTSTSEVYGKSTDIPFHEDGDQVMGATDKQRWAYASAKALEEFLALAHYRETHLPVVIVRLFNIVGPRQTWKFGMVLPSFIRSALLNRPITVYGSGHQQRCFCHVADAVEAMTRLIQTPKAYGQVINVGSQHEASMLELAERVKRVLRSKSVIERIPYEVAYQDGFEDMDRRVPSLDKAMRLVGYKPRRTLDDCIRDTAKAMKKGLKLEGASPI
jgi:UDP-glucose 4-epimerase